MATFNSNGYVVASMARGRDQMGALVPAVGHVVGRLVWYLVRDTSTTFVMRVQGDECPQPRDSGAIGLRVVFLCVRISGLLGSVVGDVEQRITGSNLRCYWPSATAFVGMARDSNCKAEWCLCDLPAGFIQACEAANERWLVRCGDNSAANQSGDPDRPDEELVLVTVKLMNDGGSVGEAVITALPRSVVCTIFAVCELKFMPSRPDELMLAVCGLRDTTPTLVVVDVEGTHRSGTLRVVSTTRCLTGIRGYLSLDSAFPMRRKDGTRSFFIEVELYYFEVEESTGVARLLSGGSYWPLSDSEYFLDGRVRLGDVPIWDCNNRGTTTPLKVIKIPTVPPERSNTRRGGGGDKRRPMLHGSRGFLFHTNTAESCITVIDPNLRNHTTMTPQQVTVLVLSFPLWPDLSLSIDFAN